jgi:hypothetical protein
MFRTDLMLNRMNARKACTVLEIAYLNWKDKLEDGRYGVLGSWVTPDVLGFSIQLRSIS